MDMQHTPGPWAEIDKGLPHVIWTQGVLDGNFVVATANKGADARLIAAAPDLLAATQLHITRGGWQHDAECPAGQTMGRPGYDESKCDPSICSMAQLRAAIDKATGR